MDNDSPAAWALFAFKAFCCAVIMITTAFTVYTVGPVLETKYFPAVSRFKVLTLEADKSGNAVITVRFTKRRDECEYIGISWFRGSRENGFERVPVVLTRKEGDTSSPNRPAGVQTSGPWLIGIPKDEFSNNSFATLFHRCHPFWTTVSEVWP